MSQEFAARATRTRPGARVRCDVREMRPIAVEVVGSCSSVVAEEVTVGAVLVDVGNPGRPDLTIDVLAAAGVNHNCAVNPGQGDGDEASAADGPYPSARGGGVQGAETTDAAFGDVLVDDRSILQPGLRSGDRDVLDLYE